MLEALSWFSPAFLRWLLPYFLSSLSYLALSSCSFFFEAQSLTAYDARASLGFEVFLCILFHQSFQEGLDLAQLKLVIFALLLPDCLEVPPFESFVLSVCSQDVPAVKDFLVGVFSSLLVHKSDFIVSRLGML